MVYAEVKYYLDDNGIFSAEEYHQECMDKGQSLALERNIKMLGPSVLLKQ
jgi:hypothetical protein